LGARCDFIRPKRQGDNGGGSRRPHDETAAEDIGRISLRERRRRVRRHPIGPLNGAEVVLRNMLQTITANRASLIDTPRPR
jgi:hypothetical protein